VSEGCIGCARVVVVCNPHNYRSTRPVKVNPMCVTNSSDLFGNKILVWFKDLYLSGFQSNVRFYQEIRPMLQSYQHLQSRETDWLLRSWKSRVRSYEFKRGYVYPLIHEWSLGIEIRYINTHVNYRYSKKIIPLKLWEMYPSITNKQTHLLPQSKTQCVSVIKYK